MFLLQIELLKQFEHRVKVMLDSEQWTKTQIVGLFSSLLPEFKHEETGRSLEQKM